MKHLIFYIIFLFMFCGCYTENTTSGYKIYDLQKVQDTDKSSLDSGSLHYIALEFNEQCPIGYMDKVILTDTYIFIKSDDFLYRFSLDGKFLNSIGKYGESPSDIQGIFDFAIDEKQEKALLLDMMGKKIAIYSFDNEFQYSIPYEGLVRNMEYDNDRIFLTFMNLGNESPKLQVMNMGGEVSYRSPNDIHYKFQDMFALPSIKNIQPINQEEILIRQNFNDTIYTYARSTNGLNFRYIFEFGDSKLPYDLLGSHERFVKENENYAYLSDVTETKNRIYVDFVFHGKSKKVIIDKSKDKIYEVQNSDGGMIVEGGFHFFWPKWISSAGCLIDYIPADYMVQNKDKITDKKLIELVNILNEESNPVLILYEDKSADIQK
ncbi:6-bladed beta-propeller [Parabacteroides sp.]